MGNDDVIADLSAAESDGQRVPEEVCQRSSTLRGDGEKTAYVACLIFSARCNIYISRLCYDVSVCLSVRLSVTEVHWHITANLDFKFRSQFTAHCGRGACGARGGIIAGKSGGIISRYASYC